MSFCIRSRVPWQGHVSNESYSRPFRTSWQRVAIAFSLPVLTEGPHPTRLFLKKSRTSLNCPVQSRSENALAPLRSRNIGNRAITMRPRMPAFDAQGVQDKRVGRRQGLIKVFRGGNSYFHCIFIAPIRFHARVVFLLCFVPEIQSAPSCQRLLTWLAHYTDRWLTVNLPLGK